MRYFHGGTPGLFSGELILPPATTGTSRCLADLPIDAPAGRRDRVYVTTGRDVARVYAAFYPDGALYEVEPEQPEPDPDCFVPGVSFECLTARIVRVVDPVVLLRTRSVDAWIRYLNRATAAAGTVAVG